MLDATRRRNFSFFKFMSKFLYCAPVVIVKITFGRQSESCERWIGRQTAVTADLTQLTQKPVGGARRAHVEKNIQENFRLCGLKYLADTFLTR